MWTAEAATHRSSAWTDSWERVSDLTARVTKLRGGGQQGVADWETVVAAIDQRMISLSGMLHSAWP